MKRAAFAVAVFALAWPLAAGAVGGSTSFPTTKVIPFTYTCKDDLCLCSDMAVAGYADKAETYCTNALAAPGVTDTQRADALVGRAIARLSVRRYDDAVADATQGLAVYVQHDDKFGAGGAYFRRGQAYFQLRDDAHAFADFSAAIAAEPPDMKLRAVRGMAWLVAGNTDAALKDFQAGIDGAGETWMVVGEIQAKITYTGSDAYFGRGAVYFLAGQYDQAANDFTKSAALEPESGVAMIWLHYARERAGRDDSAELAANEPKLDPAGREAAVLKLFQGHAADTVVNDIASGPEGSDGACEGILAVAEWNKFTRHDDVKAARAYRAVAGTCPRAMEVVLAQTMLKTPPANLPR